ncbi:hypothetical protein [Ferrovum sp.]|uniref:hypothetical protein n=1 Tax=Ferrovum sp. TaxID=2609467 RepID=UPI0026104728|nr:hypothetical protein [Ferrovum sp.]
MGATLSISVVVYRPAEKILTDTLVSLRQAIRFALATKNLSQVSLCLVDNGEQPDYFDPNHYAGIFSAEPAALTVCCLAGHGNIGYGRGHNLALVNAKSEYHLVLNPDVILEQDALACALEFFRTENSVALISPQSRSPDGSTEYLCKRYPALLNLLLRGFAPAWLKKIFSDRLSRYEYKTETDDRKVFPTEIISGCFMFGKTEVFRSINGFSSRYFMYFEDFDLSLRAARYGRLLHAPTVKITHLGGKAASKGWNHIMMFLQSARMFYHCHGWRIF